MKKLFSIAFLAFFLYNLAGYYLVFQWENASLKMEMREKIEKEEDGQMVLMIPISEKNAIAWENEKEFRWKGRLYDLAFREMKDGKIYLHCYQDSKEEGLLAGLNDHLSKDDIANQTGSSKSHSLKKAIEKDYFYEKSSRLINRSMATVFTYPQIKDKGYTFYPEVLPQPPRQA